MDTLRALAIILVFIHNFYFANKSLNFGIVTKIGWVGVDLFFTLSGFLISEQIFKLLSEQKFSLKLFIVRRFLRIAPNYITIVILYYCFINFRDSTILPPLWKILIFTSNIGLKTGTGLSYTWSLCIEEQFYLILPLILLCFHKKPKFIVIIITLGLILECMLRIYLWKTYVNFNIHELKISFQQFSNYQTKIYFSTFTRLDELLIGILIATIKNKNLFLWNKMCNYKNEILIFGISILSISFYLFYYYSYYYISTAIGYTMLGTGFGLVLINVLIPSSYLYNLKIFGIHQIAIISFAIYIVEKPINHLVVEIVLKYNIVKSNDILIFFIASIISIMSALILYNLIELPFIKLRNKICLSNKY